MKFTATDFKAFLGVIANMGRVHAPPDHEQGATYQNLDWAKILVVFFLASAINIALLSLQIHSQHPPATLYLLAFAITFSFTCFFVRNFFHSNSPEIVHHMLHRFSIFSGVTAFFVTISIPFPLWFKCITCFIYALSWLAILLCNPTLQLLVC